MTVCQRPLVQKLAQAAVDDGLVHPDVQKLGNIGSQGKHPGNSHRDLLLLSGSHALVATSPTCKAPIRLKFQTLTKTTSREISLDFLLPHKLSSCLFHSLPQAFGSTILGVWKSSAPVPSWGMGLATCSPVEQVAKAWRSSGWTSMLSQGSTRTTNFLLFLLVKTLVKDTGFIQTWHSVWKIITWSLDALRSGVWPLVSTRLEWQ